jgi:hypothetical protein
LISNLGLFYAAKGADYREKSMRKHLIVAASVLVLAVVGILPASAKWGCAARSDNGVWIDGDGLTTEKAARAQAMAGCKDHGGKGCHITDCSPDVDTDDQAAAKWPPPAPPTFTCGNPGQPKC